MAKEIKYIPTKRFKPNSRQVETIANYVVNGGNMGKAMLDAGYSPAYAKNPQKIERCLNFKEALDIISDQDLLSRAREIALGEDKRASLVAIDMLLKLKDRYPAGKLKVAEYEEELDSIQAAQNPPTIESPLQ